MEKAEITERRHCVYRHVGDLNSRRISNETQLSLPFLLLFHSDIFYKSAPTGNHYTEANRSWSIVHLWRGALIRNSISFYCIGKFKHVFRVSNCALELIGVRVIPYLISRCCLNNGSGLYNIHIPSQANSLDPSRAPQSPSPQYRPDNRKGKRQGEKGGKDPSVL